MDMGRESHFEEKDIEVFVEMLLHEHVGDLELEESEEIEALEQHLSNCKACSEKVEKVYRQLLPMLVWDVKKDNEALMKKRLASALDTFLATPEAAVAQDRVLGWKEKVGNASQVAFKVIMDFANESIKSISRFIIQKDSSQKNRNWDIGYGREWVMARGGEKKEQKNCAELSVKNPDKGVGFTAKIDEKGNSILLNFEKDTQSTRIPLVLLIPEETGLPAVFGEPVYDPDNQSYSMTFHDVRNGHYFFAIEP